MPYTIVLSQAEPQANSSDAIMSIVKATVSSWGTSSKDAESGASSSKTSLTGSGVSGGTMTLSESVGSTFISDVRAMVTNPSSDGSGNYTQSITITGNIPQYGKGNNSSETGLIEAFTNLRKWALTVNHSNDTTDTNSKFIQVVYFYQASGGALTQTRVYASNYVCVSDYYENIQPGQKSTFSLKLVVNKNAGGMLILSTANDVSNVSS